MGTLKLTPVTRHTQADFSALPEGPPYIELVDGEFFLVPSAQTPHQTVGGRLFHWLTTQLSDTGEAYVFHAPYDVYLGEFDVPIPDVSVVRKTRRKIITRRGIEGAPDLVVEILSPSNRSHDLIAKRGVYERAKIPEYWIIDTDAKTIDVLVLTRGKYSSHALFKGRTIARSKVFPTIEVRLTELFAPL